MPGGWVLENQGFGPAMKIRYSDYTDGNKNMEPIAPLGNGDRRTNLHNQISQALDRRVLRMSYESGLKCGTAVQRAGNSVQTRFYKSYKKKRTMNLIDEFNAATQSLDRILEKMEEADPADKERLEAYVKSMQVKVQQILKAILRVH